MSVAEAIVAMGMLAAFIGAVGIGTADSHQTAAEDNAQAQLDLQQDMYDNDVAALELAEDEFEYQKEQDLQQERMDILSQANDAAMQIDTIGQSITESKQDIEYYNTLSANLIGERDDALSMHDVSAAKQLSSTKLGLALTGAKSTTGSALAVATETERNLLTDRNNLAKQYNDQLGEYDQQVGFLNEAITGYNEQIGGYDTLLTDIYTANNDWIGGDDMGEYGGIYGDWTERFKELYGIKESETEATAGTTVAGRTPISAGKYGGRTTVISGRKGSLGR